ncbi:MAG: YIP1 family protein [Rubrobacter sp.]
MDFNTGSGDSGGSGRSPRGPGGAPPRVSGGGSGVEFNFSDPVGSFIAAARGVLLGAANFFRSIARQGDIASPIVFALICYEVYAILAGILSLLFGGITSFGTGSAGEQAAGAATSVGGFVVGIILAPIIAAIILFVMSGIRHLLVIMIVGRGNAGFEATLRVQAYTFATRLFWWIPILGAIVGFFYGIYLSVIGIREVHSTTTGKAALVVLIPLGVFLILLALLAAVLGAVIFTVLQQQVQ